MKILDTYIEGNKEITEYGDEKGNFIRRRVRTVNEDDSLTQQQFRDQSEINNIIKRHNAGEAVTHLNKNPMVFTDLVGIPDYPQALQTVINAENAFAQLNAETRNRFGNDPNNLINFLKLKDKPEIYDEGVQLGLFKPKDHSVNQDETKINEQKTTKTKNDETKTTKQKTSVTDDQ